MKSEHSPTPWHSIYSKSTPYMYIDAVDGFHVALLPNPPREAVANAGRIVMCVNGCEEIEHPEELPALIEWLRERATGDDGEAADRVASRNILKRLGVSS